MSLENVETARMIYGPPPRQVPSRRPRSGQGPRQRDRARAVEDFRRDSDLFGEEWAALRLRAESPPR
jgi:hypothetical protein